MATAPIDVALRVRGGKELDQLIKRMDKLETETEQTQKALKEAFNQNTFRGINQGATSLNRFTKEAIAAQRQVDRLARSTKRVGSVDASFNSGGSGGSLAAAAGIANLGAAAQLSQVKSYKEIKKLSANISKDRLIAAQNARKNAIAQNEVAEAVAKTNSLQARVNAREDEINQATIKRNVALGQQKSLITRITKGQIKNAEAVKKAKIEAAQFGATASDWNRKISEAKASIRGLNTELEKSNRLAKGFSNTPMQAPGVPKRRQAQTPAAAPAARKGGGTFLGAGSLKSVLALGAAYVSLDIAVRQVSKSIQVASDTRSAEQRIRALSSGYDDYGRVLEFVSRSANKFNIGNLEASNSVAQLYGRLRPLGLELSEIETVYNGFNTAAALTGATASESAGALLQLSQALGAGALRGEEFNSIAEQAPAVLQAIGNELEVPIGQLKQLAKDGALTSAVLIRALKRVETEGADKLAAALDTPAQKFKTLQNRTEDLNKAFGDLIFPAVLEGLDKLSEFAVYATKDIKKTQRAVENVNKALEWFISLAAKAEEGGGWIVNAFRSISNAAKLLLTDLNPIAYQIKAILKLRDLIAGPGNPFADDGFIGPPVPETTRSLEDRLGLNGPDTDGGGGGGGAAAAPKTDDLKALEREIALTRDLMVLEGQRAKEELAGNDLAVLRIDGQIALRELQASQADAMAGMNTEAGRLLQTTLAQLQAVKQLATNDDQIALAKKAQATAVADALRPLQEQKRILEATLNGRGEEERLLIQIENIMSGLPEDQRAVVEGLVRGNAELQNQLDQAAELEQLYAQIGQRIADGLVEGITAAIDGTKSLQEVLADVLKDLGKMFLKFGVNSAFGGLGLPGFANGGRPEPGKLSIVGEKGPELFLSDTPGTVLTNDQAFDAARDAMGGGGSSEAFSENADALAVSNSYTRERVMEKERRERSTSSGSMLIETQVINNQEYATVEQVEKAAAASAKQARAQVFSDMKNRPATRRQLGIK